MECFLKTIKIWLRFIKLQFVKDRDYSVQRLFRTFWKTLLYLLIFLLPVYLSISPKDGTVHFNNWKTLIVCAIAYLAANYFVNNLGDSRNKKIITSEEITFKCISGAIEQLSQADKFDASHHKLYVIEALKYIESVTQIMVKQLGYPEGTICANLMVKKEGCNQLGLKYFGTFLDGRDYKKVLDINENKPDPGAPEAFVSRRPVYIANVHAPELNGYFKNPINYHSILSIPIIGKDNNVLGIINVDSTIKDQFGSEDVIEKIIIPKIKPFIKLIKLEKQLSVPKSTEL